MDIHSQVQYLKSLPQYEQLSPEWFAQRKDKITASVVDTVLGRNPYSKWGREEILFKKCGLEKTFKGNNATRHGQKYEDEAIALYCKRFNKTNHSFGLLPHRTISYLAGSPDDITSDGIVLEVKCPLRRKIKMGEIPHHYVSQVQINLEVCDLDNAVFIEYRPPFMNKDNEPVLNVVEIKRDREWFNSIRPILENLWKEIEHYRLNGIETHPLYTEFKKSIREKVYFDIDPPSKKVSLFIKVD